MVFIRGDTERGKDVEAYLTEAHEAERKRIASELHDDIGQRIALMSMDLDALDRALPLPTGEARTRVRALSDRCIELAKDIQALSDRLHPLKLDHLGLVAAAASFHRETSTRQHVDIAFSHDGVPDGVPKHVSLALFRVLHEAVTNAVTHAGVRDVAVTLRGTPEDIRLEVDDAGIGFDVDAALSRRAPGLVGMQQRMRLVGGELFIQSRPGAGTSVRARVPLSAF
jgi:signal transduction histidine kinase